MGIVCETPISMSFLLYQPMEAMIRLHFLTILVVEGRLVQLAEKNREQKLILLLTRTKFRYFEK